MLIKNKKFIQKNTPALFVNLSLRNKFLIVIGIFWLSIIIIAFLANVGMAIISTTRAFVEAESTYVKAMKNAAGCFRKFIITHDETQHLAAHHYIQIPVYYNQGRRAAEKASPDIRYACREFIKAGTNPKDAKNMVFLIRDFKNFPRIKKALDLWREADHLIEELIAFGDEKQNALLSQRIPPDQIADADHNSYIVRMDQIDARITALGNEFNTTFGETARWVSHVVLLLIILAAIIISVLGAWLMFLLIRDVLSGINRLNHEVEKIAAGDFSSSKMIESNTEMGRLVNAFVDMVGKFKESRRQLLQSEKMAAIGQLSAGVAHEINNPTGFILNNLHVLEKDVNSLFKTIGELEHFVKTHLAETMAQNGGVREAFEGIVRNENMSFLKEDLPTLLKETIEGAMRIKNIVSNLRTFTHPTREEKKYININEEIESALLLTMNEIKYHCTIVKEFNPVPWVRGNSQQIVQVFVNLILNASQAIQEDGTIRFETDTDEKQVIVKITDNGCGISADEIQRIFNPFYTTKDVGKGTGLGLSIVYGIIEDHGGTITVESDVGKGTTFIINLPVANDDTEGNV